MEQIITFFSLFLLLLPIILTPTLYFLLLKKPSSSSSQLLPPSPPSLPIIGHLHLLSLPLHRSFSRLASLRNNSPLLLRLGSRLALLVSSASAAEQCFTKHDLAFANRPHLPSAKRLSYNYTTLVSAPYGPHWRNLRRISAAHLFASAKLNSSAHVIGEEVARMIEEFAGGGDGFRSVAVRERLDDLALNVVMRMMVGRRCDGEERRRVRWVVKEGFELVRESSLGDFLPFLSRVGNGGREKRLVRLEKEGDDIFGNMVEEIRSRRKKKVGEEKTFVDCLLELQEKDGEYYTDEIIKGVILTMIAAGTDTSAETLEWAMSLLLNHPQSLLKANAEIQQLLTHENRLIKESDLCNLPYLQSILKETLRLYPAAPLLLPHESSQDCAVDGLHVPRGTILFVNAYHIQRDPKVWEDAASFKPERFASTTGCKMLMMPFGTGRRSCPGEGLAMRLMGTALGAMIQCLEWRRVGEEMVDMEEGAGMTMPKAKPLEALCMARRVVD